MEEQNRTLSIDWQLLKKCNLSCNNCAASTDNTNYVLLRERLLNIAREIFQRPALTYFIKLSGGEPFLHPYIKELITYLTSVSRDVKLTVETNGSMPLAKYIDIISPRLHKTINFTINVHPGQVSLESIGRAIVQTTKNGHLVSVRYFNDGHPDKLRDYLTLFACLRTYVPFDMRVMSSSDVTASVSVSASEVTALKMFANAASSGPCFQEENNPNSFSSAPSPISTSPLLESTACPKYCIHGWGNLYIDPAGMVHGARCEMDLGEGPLWRAGNDGLARARKVLRCKGIPCPHVKDGQIVFATESEARLAFDRQTECLEELAFDLSPLPPASGQTINIGAIVRSRLMRLRPSTTNADCIPLVLGEPHLIRQRFSDICNLFTIMGDSEAEEIFLSCLKFLETGDPGWLKLGGSPNISDVVAFENDIEFSEPGLFCTIINLQQAPNLEDLHALHGTVRLHHPRLRIPMLWTAQSLLHTMLWIADMDADYRLWLEIDEAGSPILHAISNTAPRHVARIDKRTKASRDAIQQEVKEILSNLQQIREPLDKIDVNQFAVVCYKCALPDAIDHYSKCNLLPTFILMDWDGSADDKIESLKHENKLDIYPFAKKHDTGKDHYCLFGRITPRFWESGAYWPLSMAWSAGNPRQHVHVDKTVLDQLEERIAYPGFIENHFSEICEIYTRLEDSESRDCFTRAMVAIETGNAGYLPISPYKQYVHPQVMALPGESVIEGGVCSGETTLDFARQVGSTGKIIAFEPLTKRQKISKKLLQGFANTVIEGKGLFSCASKIYIEDRGGSSFMSNSAVEGAEECLSIDLDSYMTATAQRCDLLKLDIEGAEIEALKGAEKTILRDHPKLQISLYHDRSHYLDIPLWLMHKLPNYEFYVGHHSPWHNETILYARPRGISTIISLISVVVPVFNGESTLARCLDSILAQSVPNIEIIIVDDASTDGTAEIIQRYADEYPGMVRAARLSSNSGPGAARNAGQSMADGEYIAFVDSDDWLMPNCLKEAALLMAKESADIVALDCMLLQPDGSRQVWGVEPGAWSGEDSLRQFLHKRTGSYAAWGKLYRLDFLQRNNILNGDTIVHQDIFFSLQAFYYSHKTIVSSYIGYGRQIRDGSNSRQDHGAQVLISFAHIVKFFEEFFDQHSLDKNSSMFREAIQWLYAWDRPHILTALNAADAAGTISTLWDDHRLETVTGSRQTVTRIVQDYIRLLRLTERSDLDIDRASLDWRTVHEAPTIRYEAYAKADEISGQSPILSVILPNYNKDKYLHVCLDSILRQTFQDFEIIVIDDASTDGSWQILRDYADVYPMIRLYRLSENSRQGVCRNIGLDKARGKFVIFVDSDDYVKPGFFEYGVTKADKENLDILFLSSQDEDNTGKILKTRTLQTGNLNNKEALRRLLGGQISPAPWAKVFRRNFLEAGQCRFAEYIYHQDNFLVMGAAAKARRMVASEFNAYSVIFSGDSATRPATRKYLHIHSVCRLLDFIQSLGDRQKISVQRLVDYCIWHFEKILLPAWQAYFSKVNELAINENDFQIFTESKASSIALLLGFARAVKYNGIEKLTPCPNRSTNAYIPSKTAKPLCSVIVAVYNQETNIAKCLESILRQSLPDFELIVVDDASTDHTLEICEAYAKRDARIQILTNEVNSGGCGKPRSIGLKAAQGRYVTFVDSDDLLLPDFLLRGVARLERNPDANIVQCAYILADGAWQKIHRAGTRYYEVTGKLFVRDYLAGKHPYWNAQAKLYRASFLQDNQFYLPDYLFEDNVFLPQVYYAANKILVDPYIGYKQIRTRHTHSAMRPLAWTARHARGYWAVAGWLSQNLPNFFGDGDKLAADRIKNLYGYPQLLEYLASLKGNGALALTVEDHQNLLNAPELGQKLLADYATLYAKKTLGKIDISQARFEVGCASTKTHLIPVVERTEPTPSPVLSIIVPAFEVEGYVERCLQSILAQCEDRIELIVVDDCSLRDNTHRICQSIATAHPLMRMFRTSHNSGPGVVRNLALDKARGGYICFVDGDDWLEAGFLSAALPALISNQPDIISYSIINHYSKSSSIFRKSPGQIGRVKALLDFFDSTNEHWGPWGRIFKYSFLNDNDIRFTNAYISEDELFLIKAFSLASTIMCDDILSVNSIRSRLSSEVNKQIPDRRAFNSQIENVHSIYRTFKDNFEENTSAILWNAYLDWRLRPVCLFTRSILHYIYASIQTGRGNPMTDECLRKFFGSRTFTSRFLTEFAVLHEQGKKEESENKK